MIWGLRSQAAGMKSRPSGDMDGIIKTRSMAPQYETKGINDRRAVCQDCLGVTTAS